MAQRRSRFALAVTSFYHGAGPGRAARARAALAAAIESPAHHSAAAQAIIYSANRHHGTGGLMTGETMAAQCDSFQRRRCRLCAGTSPTLLRVALVSLSYGNVCQRAAIRPGLMADEFRIAAL